MTAISLKTVLTNINAYRAEIEHLPAGKYTQLYAFTDCLKKINETRIGKLLLEKVIDSGKPIFVCLNNNGYNAAEERILTVHFDPRSIHHEIVVKNNIRKIEINYPVATLFHELVHIYRFIFQPGLYTSSTSHLNEEYGCLGEWDVIHGRSKDDFSENAFRREMGLSLRVAHNGVSPDMVKRVHSLLTQMPIAPIEKSKQEHVHSSSDSKAGQNLSGVSTKSPITAIQVTAENEDNIRETLFTMIELGLEEEVCIFLKRYSLRACDFAFLVFQPRLVLYYNKNKQCLDGIRENILVRILAHVIQQTPSLGSIPTKIFLKGVFRYSIFSQNSFLKRLCRYLPLTCIVERTEILQTAIKKKNEDLLYDVIQQKKMGFDLKIWHPKKNELFTLSEYASLYKWDFDSLQALHNKLKTS